MTRTKVADRPTREMWPENMRREDLAAYLRCSIGGLDKLRAAGIVPPGKRIGYRVVIWQKSAIDEWFKNLPDTK